MNGSVVECFAVECRKLASQLVVRLLLVLCIGGPFLFAVLLRAESGSPTDALYGAWAQSNGLAAALVVLGFASVWGVPVIAGVMAGDIFSSEDRYRTWKLVLTRSAAEEQIFLGKVLAGAAGTLLAIGAAAVSSLLAGAVVIGWHPLVSLSGTTFSTPHALGLVVAAWASCIPPAMAFVAVAVLLSVITRNGIFGVLGPLVLSLAMQLLLLVGSGSWPHLLLVDSAFDAWHGLLAAPAFVGPLLIGIGVSVVWSGVCLAVAAESLRRRDIVDTPSGRAASWTRAAALALGAVVVIGAVALAGSLGSTGVTSTRLRASVVTVFSRLAVVQQRQLGRTVAAAAQLEIVRPSCRRSSSGRDGPGDWECTINVLQADSTPGGPPPALSPVTYDVTAQWNGCWKAQSPPASVGQARLRDAAGHLVVNPIYTIYGCFDPL